MITEKMRKSLEEGNIPKEFIEENEKYGDQVVRVLAYLYRQNSRYAEVAKRMINAVDLQKESEDAVGDLVYLMYKVESLPFGCLEALPQDGSLSIAEVEWRVVKEMYRKEPINAASRVSINNINGNAYLVAVMCEGVQQAKDVMKKLMSTAKSLKPEPMGVDSSLLVLLELDDMNIRGQQIVFAGEYTDGDYQKLVKLVKDRDDGLISYINKKQAKLGELGADIAVKAGASSTSRLFNTGVDEYHMTPAYMDNFLNTNAEKQAKNYHSMDIYSGVSTEDAIEIAKTWGFEVVARYPIKDINNDSGEFLLMYNEKTGDFFEAQNARRNDVCYGGCRVVAFRKEGEVKCAYLSGMEGVHGNRTSFESNGQKLEYVEASYGEGVFHQYAYVACKDSVPVDWNDVPVQGMVSLPTLRMDTNLDYGLIMVSRNIPRFLTKEFGCILQFHNYSIKEAINALEMPNMVKNNLSGNVAKCYERWVNDPLRCVFKYSYATNHSVSEYNIVMRLAFAILESTTGSKYNYNECEDAYRGYIKDYLKGEGKHSIMKDVLLQDMKHVSFTPTIKDRYMAALILGKEAKFAESIPKDELEKCAKKAPAKYKDLSDVEKYVAMSSDLVKSNCKKNPLVFGRAKEACVLDNVASETEEKDVQI